MVEKNPTELFPLQLEPGDRALGCPEFILWESLSGGWAYQNFGQSLAVLARRGGLAPQEAAACIERREYKSMPREEAVALMKLHTPTARIKAK
jgi:hypothetical protein